MRSIVDALGGANPTRLRPGADCAVQRDATLKSVRPVFSAGYHPPAAGLTPATAVISHTEKATLMTIERPMFPPRAESVDSFSRLPAIGSPKAGPQPVSPVNDLRGCPAGMCLPDLPFFPSRNQPTQI